MSLGVLCEWQSKPTPHKRRSGGCGRQAALVFRALSSIFISQSAVAAPPHTQMCHQAVIEGQVAAGQSFNAVFAKGLRLYLEPLHSGWVIRVLDAHAPREKHDYAELATPPYQSVSPLLISTDWAFRAQDAVAWNPRHFRFAADRAAFRMLEHLQPEVLAGNAESEAKLASVLIKQPEGTLELLDSRFAPGLADQAKMASTVALHLAGTPHVADESAAPSALGRLEAIRFRLLLELPSGMRVMSGVTEKPVQCGGQPTTVNAKASQLP